MELDGAPGCEETSRAISATDCTLVLECSQPATFDGLEATVFGQVYTSCRHADGGSWNCTCSTTPSEAIELEAADPTSACARAADLCPLPSSLR
jgi:hypothetical protein